MCYGHLHQSGIIWRHVSRTAPASMGGWVDVDYVLMEDYEPIITDLTKIRTRTELCLQTLDTVTKVVTQAAGGNPGQSSRPADIIMQDIGTIHPGTIHILVINASANSYQR